METMKAPSWLDKEFIQSAIREKEKASDLEVTALDVTEALGKGENYASILLRVTAYLKEEGNTRHLIVKAYPTSELMQKFLDSLRGFEREIKMHHVTVPAMNRILEPLNLPPLSATPYPTHRCRTLIMQDLAHEGYKMADRHQGLDFSQGDLALKTLARFHAASLVLTRNDPTAMQDYKNNFYCEECKDHVTSIFHPLVKTMAEQVSEWPGYEPMSIKLAKLNVDTIIDIMKANPEETVVLNHGDPWVNNMLFKATDDDLEMRLIDLQDMHMGSPAFDLLYFLYTSLWSDVLQGHTRTLLQVYHREFVDVLLGSNIGVPKDLATVEDLEDKLQGKAIYGLWAATTVLPIVLADPSNAVDFDTNEDDLGRHCSSPRFKEIFQKILLHFQDKGIFEKI